VPAQPVDADRTCSSENKELAVANLCFMWPDYG
jgi:hypothetical protein